MKRAPAAQPLLHLTREDWLRTATGEPRGYIRSSGLTELWFHTGTICNLRCPFCLEGSKPGDSRIEPLLFDDARPFIDEALGLGVEQFSFTGGEPFVVKDFLRILRHALQHRPCLVLSNGTEPLFNRAADLLALRDQPHPVKVRISLDYPDAERHDAGRGRGRDGIEARCYRGCSCQRGRRQAGPRHDATRQADQSGAHP